MRRAAAWFFFLFLLIQIALPIRGLFVPGQARWGWQMYTSVEVLPRAQVDTGSGLEPVEIDDFLWQRRGLKDLGPDSTALLENHLCRTIPGAVAVQLDDRRVRACG
jgi:hypothetical protein